MKLPSVAMDEEGLQQLAIDKEGLLLLPGDSNHHSQQQQQHTALLSPIMAAADSTTQGKYSTILKILQTYMYM